MRREKFGGTLLFTLLLQLASTQSASAAVGRTQGSFSVSSTGAATYQIPIWTPPGPKGIQPALALNYNSQSGDGTLGPGWSLTGLSAITRCNATLAQDGAAAAVSLTANDKFCLNGNKLRLTSGVYGAAGSTYQTELAEFSQVTAVSVAGNGPASFTVQGKDGLTYEYGNTGDSQIKATGATTPYEWLLNKVRDRAGNSYVVTYGAGAAGSQGNGVPLSLSYTASSSGGSTYVYKVILGYGPDSAVGTTTSYVAGNVVVDSNLLTSISVTRVDNGNILRKYVLDYEPQLSPSTRKYRLKSVKECADAAASDCTAATAMTYQDGQSGMTGSWISYGDLDPNFYAPFFGYMPGTQFDFNGDGKTDIIDPSYGSWQVRFSTGQGFSSAYPTGATVTTWGTAIMGDVLGNGMDGILAPNSGTWWYYTWNGSAFTGVSTGIAPTGGTAYLADINGDGRPDLVTYDSYTHVLNTRLNTSTGASPSFSSTVSSSTWCAGYYCQLITSKFGNALGSKRLGSKGMYDFNGDGREDLLTTRASSPYDAVTYGALLADPTNALGFTDASLSTTGYPLVGDFNSDRCDDIASSSSYYTSLGLSLCNGTNAGGAQWYTGVLLTAIDWNGDGSQDLLSGLPNITNTGVDISFTPTSGAVTEQSSFPDASGGGVYGSYFAFDVDGDGLDDLGYIALNTVTGCCDENGNTFQDNHPTLSYMLHQGAGVSPDLLLSVTDGYGVSNNIQYVSIAKSNYVKGTGATYPERDIQVPMYVVSQVTTSDGTGGAYTQTYNYTGAREDIQGRSFEGFQSVTMTDSRANTPVVKTYYKTAFPYTGMVYQQDVFQNNGTTLISRTINTPAVITLSSTTNQQRYFPYVASTTTDRYEVGGTKNGLLVAQSSTSFTYDNYGNLTSSTSTLSDKDSTTPVSPTNNQVWTTTVTNTIAPNTASWCLGLPTRTVVTKSATSVTAITRTTDYTPDYVNCRMTQQIVEPASATYKVTTALGYDSFGNVNSQTVTGINMTARTTTVNWGATGQFPISVTNPLLQLTAAGYDYDKGVQTSQTDPNGLITSWGYDSFGRKTLETRPDNTSTLWTYSFYAAAPITEYVQVSEQLRNTAGSVIRTNTNRFDIFERPTVQIQQLVTGNSSAKLRAYNPRGQVQYDYFPYDTAGANNGYATFTYDALNRVTQVQRPISATNSALQTTSIAYLGMTTTTTDAQGKNGSKSVDPNGWFRRTRDAYGYYLDYTYDAFGSVKSVKDSNTNTLFSASYAYGIAAFQTQTVDTDLGTWNYTNIDALGEVLNYTDARASAFTLTYDKLSRPLTKFVSGDGTTTWTWGTTASSFNIGQLQAITNTGGTTENYTYDNKSRLSQRQIVSDATYNYNYTYDAATGLLDTVIYPTSTSSYRLTLKYVYQYGLLNQVKDNNGTMVFWQANAMNPRGQVTQETLGNGIVTNRSFDAVTGWINSIQSGVGGGTGVQNEAYLFDKMGNLTQRQNNTLGLTESFFYDNVYRLDYSKLNGVTNLDLTYDAMGNITNRTDVASNTTWTYSTTKRHAVTQAGSASFTYTYDANGNVATRNGFTFAWNKSNYPTSIAGSGETATLSYDGNNQRWKQVYVNGSTTETTIYVGNDLEKVTTGSTTDWRHYVRVGGQTVALYSRLSSGTNTLRFMLEDYQGSPSKITTNSPVSTYVSENFSAYGNRRNPATWSGAPTSADLTNINNVSRQGYTGHDVLGNLGLNHMNGRVQDAITGRFLSADPYITEPGNTQNYNRYSYVLNNPMSFVDPTGFNTDCEQDPNCPLDEVTVTGGGSTGATSSITAGNTSENSGNSGGNAPAPSPKPPCIPTPKPTPKAKSFAEDAAARRAQMDKANASLAERGNTKTSESNDSLYDVSNAAIGFGSILTTTAQTYRNSNLVTTGVISYRGFDGVVRSYAADTVAQTKLAYSEATSLNLAGRLLTYGGAGLSLYDLYKGASSHDDDRVFNGMYGLLSAIVGVVNPPAGIGMAIAGAAATKQDTSSVLDRVGTCQ